MYILQMNNIIFPEVVLLQLCIYYCIFSADLIMIDYDIHSHDVIINFWYNFGKYSLDYWN